MENKKITRLSEREHFDATINVTSHSIPDVHIEKLADDMTLMPMSGYGFVLAVKHNHAYIGWAYAPINTYLTND